MKTPIPHHETSPQTFDVGRRSVLGFVAAALGLALLPRGARSSVAAEAAPGGPAVRVARIGGAAGAQGAGLFRLRVREASVNMPFAIEARYGADTGHRFWQAWKQQHDGAIAHSHAVAVTCHARPSGLELAVRANGSVTACAVPAAPGTYVLTVASSHAAAGGILARIGRASADVSQVVLEVESIAA